MTTAKFIACVLIVFCVTNARMHGQSAAQIQVISGRDPGGPCSPSQSIPSPPLQFNVQTGNYFACTGTPPNLLWTQVTVGSGALKGDGKGGSALFTGTASDCTHVDGSSASCGGGAPTGAAGGDLSGTYPNPTVSTINGSGVVSAIGSELAPALTAGNWTVGSGWESPIVGPGLIKNANGTGTQTPSTPLTIVSGTTYLVSVTVSALSAGTFVYSLGGQGGITGGLISAAGTYTDYVTAVSTASLIITPTSTSRFTISAISVKAVTANGLLLSSQSNSGTVYTSNIILAAVGALKSRLVSTGAIFSPLSLDGNGSVTVQSANATGWVLSTNSIAQLNSGGAGNALAMGFYPGFGIGPQMTFGKVNTTLVVYDGRTVGCCAVAGTTVSRIVAGTGDVSTSQMFQLRLNDDTTKTLTAVRDGYFDTYKSTATAGTGVPPIYAIAALTGQTASIGTTNLQCGGAVCPAGVYRVLVEQIVTTAGTSGTVQATIGWNDGTAARTATPASSLTFGTTPRSDGQVVLTADGVNNITYATTVTSAVGSPQYALNISLERLR